MTFQVANLIMWEWFKLRRRWMPWILLAIAIVQVQAVLWFGYAAYHDEALQGFTTDDLDELRTAFTIPVSTALHIQNFASVAPIFVIILAASLTGSEYGWGTLRPNLTRGVGRARFLAAKLALVLAACAAGFIVVGFTVTCASVLASIIPPEEVGEISYPGRWADVVVTFIKAIFVVMPYATLATFLAVLTQSSGTSLAIGLGYYVFELITIPLLNIASWGDLITNLLIGNQVNGLMQAAFVTVEWESETIPTNEPEILQAALMLVGYTVVFAAAAFWIFLRRDIAGARGD